MCSLSICVKVLGFLGMIHKSGGTQEQSQTYLPLWYVWLQYMHPQLRISPDAQKNKDPYLPLTVLPMLLAIRWDQYISVQGEATPDDPC